MPIPLNERVRRTRENLRAAGLRPLQMWVPDERGQGFSEECRRQSLAVTEADAVDSSLDKFMQAAWADLDTIPE